MLNTHTSNPALGNGGGLPLNNIIGRGSVRRGNPNNIGGS